MSKGRGAAAPPDIRASSGRKAPAETSFLQALQALQGLSGIAPILAVMLDVERRGAPGLTATAPGVNAVILGGAIALATLSSGFLWRMFGTGAYAFMAVTASVGLCAVVIGARHEQRERPAQRSSILGHPRSVEVDSSRIL